ncbi:hypothetical protein COCON_G00067550 [Conger conger]|uniref:Receptor activity-modifying protein 3 n=1 Tax=Conger conger TaxID=82655 RepID=A0A9Q1DT70_CONCO|nr:receptor activity-modifying protein 3-like [Conger conger]KAJ8279689.1 hypothetical protein COCON_G00067550 [Conger conger]
MDTNTFTVLKLFLVGIFVNTLMASGLSATENTNSQAIERPRAEICNETLLLLEMEKCGEMFKSDMKQVDPQNWCNLTHFIREYNYFSTCTEESAVHIGCYWPNPLVENYIIQIHKHFFSNCTLDRVIWVDPPDDTLTILILVPVVLTLAMIALVVWCSKRSDILA